MSISEKITNILNSTIHSFNNVVQTPLEISNPSSFNQPFQHDAIGVFIGITGDVLGRILITGDEGTFSKIGEKMFGMPLLGEMLESFAGEFGNMIVGNLSTILFNKGITIDITPPTIFIGSSKVYGFQKAIKLPVSIQTIGDLNIIFMIEEAA